MFLVHIVVDVFVIFVAGHFVKLIFQWAGALLTKASPENWEKRKAKKERRYFVKDIPVEQLGSTPPAAESAEPAGSREEGEPVKCWVK